MSDEDSFRLFTRDEAAMLVAIAFALALIFWPYVK
jgi:hypothetical protein